MYETIGKRDVKKGKCLVVTFYSEQLVSVILPEVCIVLTAIYLYYTAFISRQNSFSLVPLSLSHTLAHTSFSIYSNQVDCMELAVSCSCLPLMQYITPWKSSYRTGSQSDTSYRDSTTKMQASARTGLQLSHDIHLHSGAEQTLTLWPSLNKAQLSVKQIKLSVSE